jgi:hypothetical protein
MANPQAIGKKLKKALLAKEDGIKKMSVPKALSIILDRDITKGTYNELKREASVLGANIYPNYNLILEEKKGVGQREFSVQIPKLLRHFKKLVRSQLQGCFKTKTFTEKPLNWPKKMAEKLN